MGLIDKVSVNKSTIMVVILMAFLINSSFILKIFSKRNSANNKPPPIDLFRSFQRINYNNLKNNPELVKKIQETYENNKQTILENIYDFSYPSLPKLDVSSYFNTKKNEGDLRVKNLMFVTSHYGEKQRSDNLQEMNKLFSNKVVKKKLADIVQHDKTLSNRLIEVSSTVENKQEVINNVKTLQEVCKTIVIDKKLKGPLDVEVKKVAKASKAMDVQKISDRIDAELKRDVDKAMESLDLYLKNKATNTTQSENTTGRINIPEKIQQSRATKEPEQSRSLRMLRNYKSGRVNSFTRMK